MSFLGKRNNEDTSARAGSRGVDVESTVLWPREQYVPSKAARNAARHGASDVEKRQNCGNPECLKGWTMPWRNRRRPVFEDHWGCSTRCLQVIVRRALRRERADIRVVPDEDFPHRHRVPLGLVMLGQGLITQIQLRAALDAQRRAGEGRIGDWLKRECGLSPAQITHGLSAQWNCPVLPLDGFCPGAMSLTVPRLVVEELDLLPLRVAGSRILYMAFKNRLNAAAAFAVEQMTGLNVVSGLLDDASFDAARSRLLESEFVKVDQQTVIDTDSMVNKMIGILEATQPVGARVVRIQQHYWLRTWLESGALSGVGRLPATGEDVMDTLFTIGPLA